MDLHELRQTQVDPQQGDQREQEAHARGREPTVHAFHKALRAINGDEPADVQVRAAAHVHRVRRARDAQQAKADAAFGGDEQQQREDEVSRRL